MNILESSAGISFQVRKLVLDTYSDFIIYIGSNGSRQKKTLAVMWRKTVRKGVGTRPSVSSRQRQSTQKGFARPTNPFSCPNNISLRWKKGT